MSSIEQAYLHSIEFSNPTVSRDGAEEQVPLAKMWVKIDRSRYVGDDDEGNRQYDDSKSFWVNAELWGPQVKHLEGVVESGASLMLGGRYANNKWQDKKGNDREEIKFVLDSVALLPWCLQEVTYKQSSKEKSPKDEG